MCLFFSFIPTTVFVTIGYFVLFSSQKAEGRIQKFGHNLAIWIFFIALFFPICGAYVTINDLCPFENKNLRIEVELEQ